MRAPVDVTYLADTVILLRYFEALGRVRRAISVIKKRTGAHEDTIREYRIDKAGSRSGQPLINFQGVLRGVPEMIGVERSADGGGAEVTPGDRSVTALILAPRGRDAAVAAAYAAASRQIASVICPDLECLASELPNGVGFVLVTEEALLGARPARALRLDRRAAGMVRLSLRSADAARAAGSSAIPTRGRLLDALGNVTFLERPFHPTTLVSLARAALRGAPAAI